LSVFAEDIAPDIIITSATPILAMRLRSHGADSQFTGINISIEDASVDELSDIMVHIDSNANSMVDAGETIAPIRVITHDDGIVELILLDPMEISINSDTNLILTARIDTDSASMSMDVNLEEVIAPNSCIMVKNGRITRHNIGQPIGMAVDGAFGDWRRFNGILDRINDQSPSNQTIVNANADLTEARAALDGDLFVYLSVSGRMLGGSAMPLMRHRPEGIAPVPLPDSDRDSVPDYLDPLPEDFDNDGVNDTMANQDKDGDGILDYGSGGADYWLNTTIPANWPPEYAGKNVTIYIGPYSQKTNMGYDSVYILLDSDGDPMTGVVTMGAIGVDHVVQVDGKNGQVASSIIYRYDSALGRMPWAEVGQISAAVDSTRMELAIPPTMANLVQGSGFGIWASIKDWKDTEDNLDGYIPENNVGIVAPLSTRSLTGVEPDAAKPRMTLAKTVNKATANLSEVLMYTITYSATKADSYNVWFNETYPAGVTFLNANPAPTSGTNRWQFPHLAMGTSGTIFINVTVNSNVLNGTVLTNRIDVDWSDGVRWEGTATSSASTTVVIIPEFGLGPLSGILLMLGTVVCLKRKFKTSRSR
jgi:uncharacterized repeat protein (TIGR01451 family)